MKTAARALSAKWLGTDSAHKKTHALLCQEYLLQSDTVIYRIRPVDEKHPVLLPVGQTAQFRIHKDKMLLQVEDADDKERAIQRGFNDAASRTEVCRKQIILSSNRMHRWSGAVTIRARLDFAF